MAAVRRPTYPDDRGCQSRLATYAVVTPASLARDIADEIERAGYKYAAPAPLKADTTETFRR